MKKARLRYKTVFLSDIHLGAAGCRIDEVTHFLKHIKCDKLVLNGDIIDAWALKRGGTWKDKHSKFVKQVLNKSVKQGTQVIYLRGNHDDILEKFLPIQLAGIRLTDKYIHKNAKGTYLVLHGDIFDVVTTKYKYLAVLGDIGYTWLIQLNRLVNRYREWRGLPYYSLSAEVKASVKRVVSFISDFEETLVRIAKQKGYKGVICGHIHTAADKIIDDVHYLNSGDWVESLTALVEEADGTIRVLTYAEFNRLLAARELQRAMRTPKLDLTRDTEQELLPRPQPESQALAMFSFMPLQPHPDSLVPESADTPVHG
jgi:UDP-2,3-diacylglucosamine pyrophosphatase LpxH